MASALPSQRVVLDEIEPILHKRGYTLVREPSPDQLPSVLRGYRPDAIAVGAKPSLVIEILPTRDRSGTAKAQQIGSLLSGQDDWRLEVIYAPRRAVALATVPPDGIRATLRQAGTMAEHEPRAALLLAWAALEAIARTLEPELAAHPLPAGMLIDLLISNGHVPQDDVTALAELAEMRNAVAHGQIDATPAPAGIRYLLELGESLLP